MIMETSLQMMNGIKRSKEHQTNIMCEDGFGYNTYSGLVPEIDYLLRH
jgi:hypothetical protein